MTDTKHTNPKDSIGITKLPLHLVSPIVKAYQSISHYLGNVKYGSWNWRGAGARASVYRAALDRHVDAWWEGEEFDPVDGTPHLANALACIGILIDAKHAGKLIDDRPPSQHAALREVRERFEALMPKIREAYKDKDPYHYTIADTDAPVGAKPERGIASASDEEWVRHLGGKCPVPADTVVTVQMRDGGELTDCAGAFLWGVTAGSPGDIVLYRPAKDSDGYLLWRGGTIPVPPFESVCAKLSDGSVKACFAGDLKWSRALGQSPDAVVAYRVIR